MAALRDIEQGDEINVSYVEPWLGEAERRQRIWAHVGQMCECGRCLREREAAAKGGEADAFDVAEIHQDIVDAHSHGESDEAGQVDSVLPRPCCGRVVI